MHLGRMAIFMVVMVALSGLIHAWFYRRMARDPELPRRWRMAVGGFLAVMAVSVPLTFVGTRLLSPEAAAPISYLGYGWMGAVFFIAVFLLPGELVRVVMRVSGRPDDPERRRFVFRALSGFAYVGAFGASAMSVRENFGPWVVERLEVPLAKLPPSLSGFRMVQLTDVHVGPTIGREFMTRLVDEVNALGPDAVVITGDLVDGTVEELASRVAPLAGLVAPAGVYFVTGNHEYYSGVDEWMAHLPTLGIRVLRNERVPVGRDGVSFDLAGIDDYRAHQYGRGHGADIAKAVADRDESRALVLLAHQPKQVIEAAEHGVDLQLSGHTHGGQMYPFGFLVRLDQPYVRGLHLEKETAIYVSRGTGWWGPPMRLDSPPEIAEIVLKSQV